MKMTLDSIGQFPLVMACNTDNNHHWSRSEPELNSFLPANRSPPTGGFASSSRSSTSRKLASVKSRKLSHGSRPNYAVVRGWEPTNNFDRETKRFIPSEQYGHMTTADHVSRQRADHSLPWTPVGGFQDNGCLQQAVRLQALMLDATAEKDGVDGGDDRVSSSLAPFMRERTRSTGSWGPLGGGGGRFSMTDESQPAAARVMASYNKNGAGGCFGSGGGRGDEYFFSDRTTANVSDASLETMRRNLVNLWASTGGDDVPHGPWIPAGGDELHPRSSSFSCGSSSGARWKHSGLELLDGHLLTTLRQVRQRYDDLPVDVTSRKRRFKTAVDKTSPRGAKTVVATSDPSDPDSRNHVQESGRKSDDFAEPSILRSMLTTERGRCYSMSVIEMRRQRRRLGTHLGCGHSGGDIDSTAALNLTLGGAMTTPPSDRQLVTLAKKNLLPVTARITDLLGKTVDFAKSIPQFRRLSLADREALLASSCLRLLLLAMAEVNLQFATTIVAAAAAVVDTGGGGGGGEEEGPRQVDAKSPPAREEQRASEEVSRAPTTHFVNSIQNFIRKCQTLDITSEEYLQMKIITLFQSGIGSVDCTLASNGVNSSSRQQLQDIVNRCHPNEKLRYSSLLLSLHTLYGVHGGMMRSLFCRHLDKSGGISTFINNSLSTS